MCLGIRRSAFPDFLEGLLHMSLSRDNTAVCVFVFVFVYMSVGVCRLDL